MFEGKTADVVDYLHKLENLPFALDVIAVDAARIEKELVEEEVAPASPAVDLGSTLNPASSNGPDAVVETAEVNTDLFAAPVAVAPPSVVAPLPPKRFFTLEAVADVVIYHSK